MEVYVITGEYGSGKTEFVLNLALLFSKQGKSVAISDLDIINYYYRSRHAHDLLAQHGIEIIGSTIDLNHSQDLPAINYAANGVMETKSKDVLIFDLAGSFNGAKVLAPFKDLLVKNDAKFYMLVNIFRERTNDVKGIIEVANEIQRQADMKINGLINNSNILSETQCQNILDGQEIVEKAAKELNTEVMYTFAQSKFEDCLKDVKNEKVFFDTLVIRDRWL